MGKDWFMVWTVIHALMFTWMLSVIMRPPEVIVEVRDEFNPLCEVKPSEFCGPMMMHSEFVGVEEGLALLIWCE